MAFFVVFNAFFGSYIEIPADIDPDPKPLPNRLLLPPGPLLGILFNSRTIRENSNDREGLNSFYLDYKICSMLPLFFFNRGPLLRALTNEYRGQKRLQGGYYNYALVAPLCI